MAISRAGDRAATSVFPSGARHVLVKRPEIRDKRVGSSAGTAQGEPERVRLRPPARAGRRVNYARPAPRPGPRPPPAAVLQAAVPRARATTDSPAAPAAWIPTVRTVFGVTAPGAGRTGDQRTRECVRRHRVACQVAWPASQGSSTSCLIGLSVATGRVTVASARATVATASRHGRALSRRCPCPSLICRHPRRWATPAGLRAGTRAYIVGDDPSDPGSAAD